MKQLLSLFLFLLPCLALAQYPSNGNQKITLGEQTTADGLIFRGVAATDTVRKPSIDTMAYMVFDTTTNIMWHYKKATSNAWLRVGGSISSGLTGVLPVANGGTNRTTMPTGYILHGDGTSVDTSVNLFWDRTSSSLGVGTNNPTEKIHSAYNIAAGASGYGDGNIILKRGSDGLSVADFGINTTSSFAKFNTAYSFFAFNTENIERMRITTIGLGIGNSDPKAKLHLKEGTSSEFTAPLKFTSGTLMTIAEAGAMEFNGTNLFFSPSTTRHTVNHGLTGSATLNFPSTTTLLSADLTITVTGAADGDVVSLGVPNAAVNANTSYSAWVSAANTVTVRFNNYSSGTVDPASGLFKVFVTK
jgi:hypothetical protein